VILSRRFLLFAGEYAFTPEVGVMGAALAAMLIASAMQAVRALSIRQSVRDSPSTNADPVNSGSESSSSRPLRNRVLSSLSAAQLLGRVSVTLALVLYPAASRNAISLLNCAEVRVGLQLSCLPWSGCRERPCVTYFDSFICVRCTAGCAATCSCADS
jgi:hypothetical protein